MLELVTYDVFTKTPFLGNPLAIVLDAQDLTTAQMRTLAQELNLSETIFVMPPDDTSNTAKVRIFFPRAEIPFAGHPTIGCAIHLSGLVDADAESEVEIVLEEEAGLVPVLVRTAKGQTTAEFTAPLLPEQLRVIEDRALVAEALGLEIGDIGNPLVREPEVWQAGPSYLLVPVGSLHALGQARPVGHHWDALTDRADTISAWLFCSDGENRVRARMFSPTGGTPEDPATGSAVVTFAGLFAHHGHCNRDETRIRVTQGVEMGRRSEIESIIEMKDGKLASVRIRGSAVPISSGKIRIPQ